MKFVRLIMRCIMWAVLSAVVFLVSCQSKLIYYPNRYQKGALHDITQRHGRRIETPTSQGLQVAFYLPPRQDPAQPPEFVWLVTGGNGSLALDYSGEPLRWNARFGYLFIDYPGYGLCEGKPSPASIEESIIALTEKLRGDLHWSEGDFRERSGVFGHSLGCAAGLIAADRLQLRRAVLCAPFTTMTDMARLVVGWPLCYLNRHRFDNITHLAGIIARGAQVRIFHGTEDEVIPITMSRKLAQKFPQNVRLSEIEGSHHNEIVMDAQEAIGTAMQELCRSPAR